MDICPMLAEIRRIPPYAVQGDRGNDVLGTVPGSFLTGVGLVYRSI